MLAVSLGMFALVSAFVAFGSWPGSKSAGQVDQVVLADVAKPTAKPVRVRADAVALARRAAARRASRFTTARIHSIAPFAGGNGVAQAPAASGPAPTTGGGIGGTAVAQAPSTQQTTQRVTNNLSNTTQQVGSQVQQQVGNVQTQVNQVVDQVIGGPQPSGGGSVSSTVGGTVTTVTTTAGSLLGH